MGVNGRAICAATMIAMLGTTHLACSNPKPDPIRIEGRTLIVQNHTDATWTMVEIWVNDHFRATVPRLAAGGRLDAVLDGFVTGFGRRFDPGRQAVYGVEVTARRADGGPVTVVWGQGRRR